MDKHEATSKYYMFRYYTRSYSPHSYSLESAATLLGLNADTLLSYIKSNELPAEARGETYQIAVSDLEDFLLFKSKGIVLRRER